MYGKSLNEYYENTVGKIVDIVRDSGEIKEGMELEFVKIKIFELINMRVINLLNEMNNKNASTLTRGLIALMPEKMKTESELVDNLVYYHREEKLAIRKFRHSDKKEVELIKMNEMFDKVIESTENSVKFAK